MGHRLLTSLLNHVPGLARVVLLAGVVMARGLRRDSCRSLRAGASLAILLSLSGLAGCVGPITQIRCDQMARKAIRSIAVGDTDTLNLLLFDQNDSYRIMANFPTGLPLGRIRTRGDSYLFPMPTYSRYYEVLPDARSDQADVTSSHIVVTFRSGPLRIDNLHPYAPDE